MPRPKAIADRLADLRRRDMYRRRRVVDSPQGGEIVVDGRRLLNFCSNDYLGLAADARIRESFAAAAGHWGTGSGASHLVCGHTRVHHELEEALAHFTGRPRALLFSSGYAANMGTISAVVGPGDRVLEDRLNHASLLDGGWISRAEFGWYRHCDVADLAEKLAVRDVATGKTVCRPQRLEEEPPAMQPALKSLLAKLKAAYPNLPNARWVAMRLLAGDNHLAAALRQGELGILDEAAAAVPVTTP